MMKIVATRDVSFGSGTRLKGFVFGELALKDGIPWGDVRRESYSLKLPEMKNATVAIAEGVSPREFGTAVFNVGTVTELLDVVEETAPETPVVTDWRALLVADADLTRSIKSKLNAKGLRTFGDVEKYAAEHQGFEGLDFKGTQDEVLIECMGKIIPKDETTT